MKDIIITETNFNNLADVGLESADIYFIHDDKNYVCKYEKNDKIKFLIYDENENLIEVLDKVIDRSNNTFYLSRLDNKFGLLDEKFNVVIKNSIYGKFEVLQRINETTFLIKIAERDLFVDSEGNFR